MKTLTLAILAALVAASPVNYIHHPRAVARTIERRLDRQYARNPLLAGATVQVECTPVARLVDDCQVTIIADGGGSYWIDLTVDIAVDGHSFRIVDVT